MQKTFILMPQYLSRFSCTQETCQANCCHGVISIDRETYRKYCAVSHPGIKAKLKRVLAVNKTAGSGADNYAVIDNQGKPCVFLDNGRCQIQLELGAGHLSRVCHTVPRVINKVPGMVEISCKMLCPEAVRLALDNPEPMCFDLTEGELDRRYHIAGEWSGAAVEKIQPSCLEIRDLAIDLLQDRKFGFSERMIRLGVVISEIDKLTLSGPAGDIGPLIEKLRKGFEVKLNSIPNADDLCFHYLDMIVGAFVAPTLKTNGPQYYEWLSRFLQGLSITAEVTPLTVQRFRESCALYYEPFMSEHQYIYENYFVSYVFSRLFPLRQAGTALGEYHKMVWYYLILHTVLVGIAAHNNGLSKEIVLDFITRYSTIVESGPKIEGQLMKAVQDRNLNNLYLFYSLLRPGQC